MFVSRTNVQAEKLPQGKAKVSKFDNFCQKKKSLGFDQRRPREWVVGG